MAKTNNLIQQVREAMMPVGYVFEWAPVDGSALDLSTAEKVRAYFGFGTWQVVSSGRVLMGSDDAHEAGTTAEAGLPNIEGSFGAAADSRKYVYSGAFSLGTEKIYRYSGATAMDAVCFDFDASKSNAIYGASETVQPPAYYVYIWKRIA